MSFAQQFKNCLLKIISGIAMHPEDFSKHPNTDFSSSANRICQRDKLEFIYNFLIGKNI